MRHTYSLPDEEEAINSAVIVEIDKELKGKSYAELVELEVGIKQNISSGEVHDEEYWQSLLKRIVVRKNEVRYSCQTRCFILISRIIESHSRMVAARMLKLSELKNFSSDDIDNLYQSMMEEETAADTVPTAKDSSATSQNIPVVCIFLGLPIFALISVVEGYSSD